ncbi:hypothetical protein AKJ16_DCAP00728 [Drosera capensis]
MERKRKWFRDDQSIRSSIPSEGNIGASPTLRAGVLVNKPKGGCPSLPAADEMTTKCFDGDQKKAMMNSYGGIARHEGKIKAVFWDGNTRRPSRFLVLC